MIKVSGIEYTKEEIIDSIKRLKRLEQQYKELILESLYQEEHVNSYEKCIKRIEELEGLINV